MMKSLGRGAGEAVGAQPLDQPAQPGRRADQRDDSYHPAGSARGGAADRTIKPRLEELDRAPRQDNRMRHMAEHRPHLAAQSIDGEADIEQQKLVVQAGQVHRPAPYRKDGK